MSKSILKKYIPIILVLTLILSGTPFAFANGDNVAVTGVRDAAVAEVEELTVPVPEDSDTPYNGYIVTLKDAGEVDAKAEKDYSVSASGDFVTVDAPEDVLAFTDPDNIIAIEPNYEISALVAPNDPSYKDQWDLRSTPAGIEAEAAWDVELDGTGVNVAIFDTGFSYQVDDFHTENVVETMDFYGASGKNTHNPTFPKDVTDGFDHGTGVSSYIGAIKNNNLKMAGLAPNSNFYLYKVLNDAGKGSTDDVIFALDYLYKQGREYDVINFSLGQSVGPDTAENIIIQKWIEKGTIVVAAAGNEGKGQDGTADPVFYPAGYSGVIAVAATDSSGNHAYFSNENETIDVAAPGTGTWHLSNSGGMVSGQGTSFASPEVAGVAALVKQYYKDHDMTVDAGVFLDILKNTSTQKGEKPVTPAHDISYGWGLVNVANIMEKLDPTIQKYTVTFDANGGMVGTALTAQYVVEKGAALDSIPEPEKREQYTFDGWYTAATDGNPITITAVTNVTASATYYAHWTKDTPPPQEGTTPPAITPDSDTPKANPTPAANDDAEKKKAANAMDAKLRALKLSAGKLSTKFSADKTSYKLTLPAKKSTIKLTLKKSFSGAKIQIKVDKGKYKTANSVKINLKKGKSKTVYAKVTSANKKQSKIYKFKVTRKK
jgi:uncharacterized repeat protein (TIGR02543 family)